MIPSVKPDGNYANTLPTLNANVGPATSCGETRSSKELRKMATTLLGSAVVPIVHLFDKINTSGIKTVKEL